MSRLEPLPSSGLRPRWLFDTLHPAADLPKRWRVDLAVVSRQALLVATLPAHAPGDFAFDALLEFAYGGDWWQQPDVATFGADIAGEFRDNVRQDFEKVESYLRAGAARTGWVVVFEECDHALDSLLAQLRTESTQCHVRLIRSYDGGPQATGAKTRRPISAPAAAAEM